MRKRHKTYKEVNPEADFKIEREEIRKRIIEGNHPLADISVFKHTPEEKLKLKNAKLRNRRWLRLQKEERK
jgi:hypothetical protein